MAQTADKYTRAKIETALAKHGIETFRGETVHAYVNHDRWLADCPCNGAELVVPGQTMVCGSCGAEHEVKFPRDRKRIESVLSERPGATRNWLPGETVDFLLAENIDHGIGVH